MFLVLFVLHDCELVEEVLDSWDKARVGGATVLHSYGLGRMRQAAIRDDFPLFPSIEQLFGSNQEFSRTIFTVVDNQEMVDDVVRATQSIVGDLNEPDTGMLVVLPISQAYGLSKKSWRTNE